MLKIYKAVYVDSKIFEYGKSLGGSHLLADSTLLRCCLDATCKRKIPVRNSFISTPETCFIELLKYNRRSISLKKS